MFCERCGFQLAEGTRFCSSCGKPAGMAIVPLEHQGKVERNIQILAILWLVAGALNLIACFVLLTLGNLFVHGGVFFPGSGGFPPFLRGIFAFAAILVGAHAALSIGAGWGLLQREAWARPLAIVAGFLALFHIPFGTALGVYSIWVLLPNESGDEYERLARAA
jgi:hypothetical protein